MTDGFEHVRLGPDEAESIRHRRRALSLDGPEAAPLAGLALSGGGVRSATFALGLLQGMAHGGRLDRFDMLSTVSGGGYAGAFLRSLFIPRLARFHDPVPAGAAPPGRPTPQDYRRRHDWALEVLKASPDIRRLAPPVADEDARHFAGRPAASGEPDAATANPIWWLREHGRYLAPNGSGDYIFALGYILRGWFAMQYVAIVPLIAIFIAFKLLTAALHHYGNVAWPPAGRVITTLVTTFGVEISPLMLLPAALFGIVIMPLSTSYWLTATLTQWHYTPRKAAPVSALLAAASLIALYLLYLGIGGVRSTDAVLRLGGYFFYLQVAATPILFAASRRAGDSRREIYPSELRRLLTDWLATAVKAALFCLTLAIIDSLALKLVHLLRTDQPGAVLKAGGAGGLGAFVVTAIVWLVQKLQVWLPRFAKAEHQASRLARFLPGLVLAGGLLAYGIMGVLCAAIAYLLVWYGIPYQSDPTFAPALAALALALLLALVTGLSPRFLNLSSLHYFYAGRLTRAYLGASNARRLAVFERPRTGSRAANVQEYDEGDALCLADYHRKEVLAPVHLINVTANETEQADSQLVQRDRKGNNLCVGPGGISLAGEWRSRAELAAQNAERLAVGKWIAISGAAASSGMGQATSLGTALLLTFANVRLGYWWYAPELAGRTDAAALRAEIDRHRERLPRRHASWRLRDLFETQGYLLSEAVAAYSRIDRLRLNLSDGGHFENSAAYELIRRRLPVIVVSDAAADPAYGFEDFSNLVRKARIDLGAEVRCLGREEIDALPEEVRPYCGTQEDFRGEQGTDRRCLLPCIVRHADGTPPGLLLVVKPRLPIDAPPDVAAYRRRFAAFPQEPTVDQFFGEAQWESYRCLGETLGRSVFPAVFDAFVGIARSWREPARTVGSEAASFTDWLKSLFKTKS